MVVFFVYSREYCSDRAIYLVARRVAS